MEPSESEGELDLSLSTNSLPESDIASSSTSLSSLSSSSSLFTSEENSRTNLSTTSSSDLSMSSGEIPESSIVAEVPKMTSGASGGEVINTDDGGAERDKEEEMVPAIVSPVKEKCVGRLDRVSWGFSSVIGRRKEMEDAIAVIPGFMESSCCHVGGCTAPGSKTSSRISPLHFFGVYDGHGGSQVADFCAQRMHAVIAEEWQQESIGGCEWRKKWEIACSSGFERADDEVLQNAIASDMVGSTAVVAIVSGCQIIMSNCGDSRAVLCRGTQTVPLTIDQKPDREDELLRIEREGGKVINWNGARVLGVLAMSRAIGDRYLRPYIIPVPEITFMTRAEEDECLILASDGLWDVMSSTEVGDVARCLLRRRRRCMVDDEMCPAQAVADDLTKIALGRNSSDNISIIVVDLKSRRRRQPRT